MWRLRLILVPFGAVAELLLLAVGWSLALSGRLERSRALLEWATRNLPSMDWYVGAA